MNRAVSVTTALLLAAAASLPAQSRIRDFGLSDDEWCRDARDADFCEVREETLRGLNDIEVDARGNGGVAVRGWNRNDVDVRVRLVTHARTDSDARSLAREVRLSIDRGRIRMEGPRTDWGRDDRGRDREWWSASYELQVPQNARLTLDATNGGISIEAFRGTVDARTTNGGLTMYEVGGTIRGQAVNGGVNVELTGSRFEGSGLDLRTTNGGVNVSLPSNFSAELEARAVNGGISVDFPITVQGLINQRRELRATLGSGGPLVRVQTTNGGVRIRRR